MEGPVMSFLILDTIPQKGLDKAIEAERRKL